MKIFVFGSSLTSTYWNGAATYYRGIYKNLCGLGHEVVFAEPDIYERQQHRDLHLVPYADVRVYQTPIDLPSLIEEASNYDLVIKHSGVGAHDGWLEENILSCQRKGARVVFWDVDAPATLARVEANEDDPFRNLIPRYDMIFTYGGGTFIVEHYKRLGAKACIPIYNALDPDVHCVVDVDPTLQCDLAFVGNRLPDRERRVEQFFLRAADMAPEFKFVLGGEGWGGKGLPSNIRWIGHVPSDSHNRVNCSARMVLNINRDSMAHVGFSPPTRIFEAAGAGACLITDAWEGIETFFAPGREILPASSAEEIVQYLRRCNSARASEIGKAMRARALRQHTYELRAAQVEAVLNAQSRGAAAQIPQQAIA